MTTSEAIRERLLAYILPRVPETDAQETALTEAVTAQAAWEASVGTVDMPGAVASINNDGVSMSFRTTGGQDGYSRDTLSPTAWSILRNAGLIAYTLPTAKRP